MFGDKHHTRFINNQKQFKQFIQKKQIMRGFSEGNQREKITTPLYRTHYM